MFTGIIQDIGEIAAIDKKGDWAVTIVTKQLRFGRMAIGASICCGGVCLTVIEKDEPRFRVQLSAETVGKTTAKNWQLGSHINLEPALRMGDELGGHLVSGHVDGIARIVDRHPDGDSVRFAFELPHAFAKFIAPKGSVALDGVSLTVNEVDGDRFGVNIIPHTQGQTTFGMLKAGDEVNFEVDLMARYAARLLSERTA